MSMTLADLARVGNSNLNLPQATLARMAKLEITLNDERASARVFVFVQEGEHRRRLYDAEIKQVDLLRVAKQVAQRHKVPRANVMLLGGADAAE